MHALRSQWLGLVLLLGLLIPPLAAPELLYACSMTGRLGPACCCSAESSARSAEGPAVERSACCRAEAPERHSGVAAESQGNVSVADGAFVSLDTPDVVRRPLRSVEAPIVSRSRAPPSIGPPLYIKYRSFLS